MLQIPELNTSLQYAVVTEQLATNTIRVSVPDFPRLSITYPGSNGMMGYASTFAYGAILSTMQVYAEEEEVIPLPKAPLRQDTVNPLSDAMLFPSPFHSVVGFDAAIYLRVLFLHALRGSNYKSIDFSDKADELALSFNIDPLTAAKVFQFHEPIDVNELLKLFDVLDARVAFTVVPKKDY